MRGEGKSESASKCEAFRLYASARLRIEIESAFKRRVRTCRETLEIHLKGVSLNETKGRKREREKEKENEIVARATKRSCRASERSIVASAKTGALISRLLVRCSPRARRRLNLYEVSYAPARSKLRFPEARVMKGPRELARTIRDAPTTGEDNNSAYARRRSRIVTKARPSDGN